VSSPTRQAIAAKNRSRPGKVTGRLRIALDEMVWKASSRAEAAKVAGMTDHSLREALRRPHVRRHYLDECEVLRISGRAKRLHRLEELAAQDVNRNAAVAAIKVAEGVGDEHGVGGGMVRTPGMVIVIQPGPAPAPQVHTRTIDNTSVSLPLPIEVEPEQQLAYPVPYRAPPDMAPAPRVPWLDDPQDQ